MESPRLSQETESDWPKGAMPASQMQKFGLPSADGSLHGLPTTCGPFPAMQVKDEGPKMNTFKIDLPSEYHHLESQHTSAQENGVCAPLPLPNSPPWLKTHEPAPPGVRRSIPRPLLGCGRASSHFVTAQKGSRGPGKSPVDRTTKA